MRARTNSRIAEDVPARERWPLALKLGEFAHALERNERDVRHERRRPFVFRYGVDPLFGADNPVRFRPLQKPATEP